MLIEEVRTLDPYDRLIHWIEERESIRLKRLAGLPLPWTEDEILRQYRFTNVRRMDDRVSQWLLSNWYEPYYDHPNMLVAVALARFINLPSSLEAITFCVFGNNTPVSFEGIKHILRKRKQEGHQVFNGAYMVSGSIGEDKIEAVVDYYVKPLMSFLPEIDRSSMGVTHSCISSLYGFGSFMAGQVVADLRWAIKGTWDDKDSWAPRGPGSSRGINRLYGFDPKASMSDDVFNERMSEVIAVLKEVLPTEISSRLEGIDCQSCLCEWDKMERALWGQGKPKQRYPGGS